MKVLVSGHRLHKLSTYDIGWIKEALELSITSFTSMSMGLSGMAGVVDLWFCELCINHQIPLVACPPFPEQEETIDVSQKQLRQYCLSKAAEIWPIRNSQMIKKSDAGIIVFDGNKGGTHNVFQQMVEYRKSFIWINPVGLKIWECF